MQTIADQDRGTYDVFLKNAKISQFSWKSSPIYSTDILRRIAAVGQEFRSPLDVELLQPDTTLNQRKYGLYEYL